MTVIVSGVYSVQLMTADSAPVAVPLPSWALKTVACYCLHPLLPLIKLLLLTDIVADVPAPSALCALLSDDLVLLWIRPWFGNTVVTLSVWNRLLTELRLLWLTTTFCHQCSHSCSNLPMDTEKQTDDCFVMHPRSPSRRCNTNDCYCYCYYSARKLILILLFCGG